MSASADEAALLGLHAHLAAMAFPDRPMKKAPIPTVPFAALPALPEATKRALEAAALESNDRYLETFLEPNSFCPFSRGGRTRGQTLRLVYYADTTDFAPFLERIVEAASDPSKVVIQVIMPLIEVTPEAWSRFCHEATAAGNELLRAGAGGGKDVFAIAPLHPELAYSTVNHFALIPLLRRTPDPTIQWVRLDALEALYEGRTGDTEYVDLANLAAYLTQPKRSPLFERIAETNLKMAQRLGIPEVERTLRELWRSAQERYARILLSDTPEAPMPAPAGGCAHRSAPVSDASAPRPALREDAGRWALVALAALEDRTPTRFLAADVELAVIRVDDEVHVLHGRCPHRNAPFSDAVVEGERLVCPHHGWDFQLATGRSEGVPGAGVARFAASIEDGVVWVEGAELRAWRKTHVPIFHADDDVL